MQFAYRQGGKGRFSAARLLPDSGGHNGKLSGGSDILPLIQISGDIGKIAGELPQRTDIGGLKLTAVIHSAFIIKINQPCQHHNQSDGKAKYSYKISAGNMKIHKSPPPILGNNIYTHSYFVKKY